MSTIIAMCPYCRAGGVRAPAASVGASATCPKCKSSFTVMPSEVPPGTAAPSAETVPSAVLQDVTEPSPLLPGGERGKKPAQVPPAVLAEFSPAPVKKKKKSKSTKADVPVARVIAPPPPRSEPEPEPEPELPPAAVVELPPAAPTPQPEAVAALAPVLVPDVVEEPEELAEPLDYGLALALGSLILVGPAVLASQLPFGRFIAAALSAVGLLGGVAALGAEGRARLMAVGGALLHGLILLIVFFMPSVLNLDPWLGYSTDSGPPGPFVVEHASGQRHPVTQGTWLDAGRSSWEYKDARVTVAAARVGPLELTGPKDAKRLTKEFYFQFQVRVANAGVERQIDLSGWAAGQGAEGVRVTDGAGRTIAPATFEGPWQPDRGKPLRQLFPGHPSDVKLIFAAPAANAGALRVELPGAALGLPEETVRFQVGNNFVGRPTP